MLSSIADWAKSEVASGSCPQWRGRLRRRAATPPGCCSPSVTGQPGHLRYVLSGLFVQVRARSGQSDRWDTDLPCAAEAGGALDSGNGWNERSRSAGGQSARNLPGHCGDAAEWEEAREYALPPERVVSPLAGRPYDLRHACITRWLNAGVPIAEVARRVGNSPEVIHRRYHGCIDGHEEAANAKITRALEEDGDAA